LEKIVISLFAASVPVFQQMLGAQKDILEKSVLHIAQKKIDPEALLQARLFPDMFPFVLQVRVACDFARGISARLAGIEVPQVDDEAASFEELTKLIDTSLAFIASIDASQINGKEESEIVLRAGTPKERRMSAQDYLTSYGLPQFFFHVTTAYAILRHNGIEIGKRDFLGMR
jgi:hypothetical protein